MCANAGWTDKRRDSKDVKHERRRDVEDPEVLKLARKRIDDLQDEVLTRKIKEAKCEDAFGEMEERLRLARKESEESKENLEKMESLNGRLRNELTEAENDRAELLHLKMELESLRSSSHADGMIKQDLERKLKGARKGGKCRGRNWPSWRKRDRN